MKLKVGIIDDELHAIETLVYDLKELFNDNVDVVFACTNPVEGINKIKSEQPDLLFLDMEMPRLSGIDVLSLIDDIKVQVVITTAHPKFAINTVGTKAIAYLLKPVQPEILKECVEKAIKKESSKINVENVPGRISVPVFDGIEIVECSDIIYCKSDSNYTELVLTNGKKMIASKTLKHFSNILSTSKFFRIHKSYLVNLKHIKKYLKRDGGELVVVNNDIVPISRNKRDEILKLIQNNI